MDNTNSDDMNDTTVIAAPAAQRRRVETLCSECKQPIDTSPGIIRIEDVTLHATCGNEFCSRVLSGPDPSSDTSMYKSVIEYMTNNEFFSVPFVNNMLQTQQFIVLYALVNSALDRHQRAEFFTSRCDQLSIQSPHTILDAASQNAIGGIYESGFCTPVNYDAALSWFRKAVDQHYADAQCNLGWMYEAGQGVDCSREQAMNLFRSAAVQGHIGATVAGFAMLPRPRSIQEHTNATVTSNVVSTPATSSNTVIPVTKFCEQVNSIDTSCDSKVADNTDDMTVTECCICIAKQSAYTCVPCGHMCMCFDCAMEFSSKGLKKCPKCRRNLMFTIL